MPRDSHSVHQSAETPTFGCNLRATQNEGMAEGLGSYETAWTCKLRRAMVRPGRDCLTGMVEVDETYGG